MRNGPEDIASQNSPVRVLVVDLDLRVLSALRAVIDAEPDLEVVDLQPDPDAVLSATCATRGVALVDVSPPGGHGLGLVRRLSQTPGWQVVAMSTRHSSRQAAREAGAFAFVEKGDDIEALLAVVRRAAAEV